MEQSIEDLRKQVVDGMVGNTYTWYSSSGGEALTTLVSGIRFEENGDITIFSSVDGSTYAYANDLSRFLEAIAVPRRKD